jgi:hypothetical protein
MKNTSAFALVGIGIGLGIGTYLLLRRRVQRTPDTKVLLSTQDLEYPDVAPEELIAEDLTDLNNADSPQLEELELDPQSLERLIENRPYRNKLELLSRRVLTQDVYDTIKDKIGISEGREPVKIAQAE